MQSTTLLKIGAGLFVLWGLLNMVGGVVGALDHPSALVLPFFATVGTLITAAGIDFWLKSEWRHLSQSSDYWG